MKLKNLSLVFLFFCFFQLTGKAQDAIYSQFYAAPLQINPAFAGNTYSPHIALNYRNQWVGFPQAYVTYSAAYSQLVEALNSGFGAMISSDNQGQGLFTRNQFSAFYAYKLKVNDDLNIKIGIEGGILQTNVNWDKLVFLDQLDPLRGAINPSEEVRPDALSRTNFDVSTGLLMYNSIFYVGVAVKHLTTPDPSFLKTTKNLYVGIPVRFALHGGLELPLDGRSRRTSSVFVLPNLLFVKQGTFWQLNVGSQLNMGSFFVGGWYRHTPTNPDAIIASAGFQKSIFKVGYSFDLPISRFSSANSGGSHELSLILNFDKLFDHDKVDYNDCLKLFR